MTGLPDTNTPAPSSPRRAGFWRRFLAYGLDTLCLLMLIYVSIIYGFLFFQPGNLFASSDPEHILGASLYFLLAYVAALIIALPFLSAVFIASRLQATPGKLTTRMVVVDDKGQRLRFGRALAREYAKLLSWAPLWLGFVLAAFTKEKTALHDLVARTRVVRLPSRAKVPVATPTPQGAANAAARQNPGIARLAFVFAGIGAIPVLGWPFGLIAIIWGLVSRKPGSKRVATIAGICTIGMSGIYALFYFSYVAPILEDPDRYSGVAKLAATQTNLTRAVCHIDLFRKQYGRYPDDLYELQRVHYEIDTWLRISDMFARKDEDEAAPPLIYEKDVLGRNYRLFSVGVDGLAGTEDDIYPPEGRSCPKFHPLTATPEGRSRRKPDI